jgi:hypothetical protein
MLHSRIPLEHYARSKINLVKIYSNLKQEFIFIAEGLACVKNITYCLKPYITFSRIY